MGGMSAGPEDLRLRKLFVRQLSFNTTSESLRQYFKVYGDVQEAVVLTEPSTGAFALSGFRFVCFSISVWSLLLYALLSCIPFLFLSLSSSFVIPSLLLSCSIAHTFNHLTPSLSFSLSLSAGKSKGYGFVTMATADGAARALVQPQKDIDGRTTHTKLAAEGAKAPMPATTPFAANVGNFAMGMNPLLVQQQFPGALNMGSQNLWQASGCCLFDFYPAPSLFFLL